MPEIIKKLSENGIDPYPMNASQMSTFMAADYQRMGKVIKDAGISGD
jgi:tripartite-type tricarboxylate transporter receptor subunit TctC